MSRPLDAELTPADLILYRARQLQKRPEDLKRVQDMVLTNRLKFLKQFKIKYEARIKDYKFTKGALALVWNVVRDNRHGGKAMIWWCCEGRWEEPTSWLSWTAALLRHDTQPSD